MSLLRTRTISRTTLLWKNKTNKQNTFFFLILLLEVLILFWIVSILFLSIFPICDMRSRIWNRRGDYVDFINFCLFSAYLGTYKWSVVLPKNVTDLKYAQWLKSSWPFKKWAVKVTHPTPLCLCMHGIRVIRTITWRYRLCRIY